MSRGLWKNNIGEISKFLLIFIIIFSWVFFDWLPIFNFPPKIQEAQATVETFITAGTFTSGWTAPADVVSVTAETWGGGGGSGGGTNGGLPGGSGGGGGAYASKVISVTPGNSYTYVVGAAGLKDGGTAGGNSSFTGDASVQSLACGGTSGAANGGTAGAGGTTACSDGTSEFAGGAGAAGAGTSGGGGGESAGTTATGGSAIGTAGGTGTDGTDGSAGQLVNVNGVDGNNPGAGAGGSGQRSGGVEQGASGGVGQVRLTYTAATPTTFTQNDFEWFIDQATVTLTDPWPAGSLDLAELADLRAIPAQNNPPGVGEQIRLQINLTIGASNLSASAQAFTLQYKVGTDEDCSTGSWTDVGAKGATTVAWRLYDNTSLGDSVTEVNQILSSEVAQLYSETNPNLTNPNTAVIGNDIEYDWPIESVSGQVVDATTYAFRMVKSGGATISYTVGDCPTIETEPGTSNLMRHGNFFIDGLEKGFFWAD